MTLSKQVQSQHKLTSKSADELISFIHKECFSLNEEKTIQAYKQLRHESLAHNSLRETLAQMTDTIACIQEMLSIIKADEDVYCECVLQYDNYIMQLSQHLYDLVGLMNKCHNQALWTKSQLNIYASKSGLSKRPFSYKRLEQLLEKPAS